jgi:hypothetical protein
LIILKNFINFYQVEGTDLLKLEREATNSMTGKKIIYRKEYLDSLESSEQGHKTTIDFNYLNTDKTFINEKIFISNYGFPPSPTHNKKTYILTTTSSTSNSKYKTIE